MPSCLRSGRITASANLRLLQQEDRGVAAVTTEKRGDPRLSFCREKGPGGPLPYHGGALPAELRRHRPRQDTLVLQYRQSISLYSGREHTVLLGKRTTVLRLPADLSCPHRPADLRNVRFIGEHGRHHAAWSQRVGMAEQVAHLVDDRQAEHVPVIVDGRQRRPSPVGK